MRNCPVQFDSDPALAVATLTKAGAEVNQGRIVLALPQCAGAWHDTAGVQIPTGRKRFLHALHRTTGRFAQRQRRGGGMKQNLAHMVELAIQDSSDLNGLGPVVEKEILNHDSR